MCPVFFTGRFRFEIPISIRVIVPMHGVLQNFEIFLPSPFFQNFCGDAFWCGSFSCSSFRFRNSGYRSFSFRNSDDFNSRYCAWGVVFFKISEIFLSSPFFPKFRGDAFWCGRFRVVRRFRNSGLPLSCPGVWFFKISKFFFPLFLFSKFRDAFGTVVVGALSNRGFVAADMNHRECEYGIWGT